jgi:nucleoside 2-deoxyribosyltransferase
MQNERYLRIDKDFKFTEEVIKLYEKREELNKFDIGFKKDKKCQITSINPAIGNSAVCKNCYYPEFTEKMYEVRKSKRQDFLQYQMDLRKNPKVFLNELSELLEDSENYFDGFDYSFASEYQNLIKIKISELDGEKELPESSFSMDFKQVIAQEIGKNIAQQIPEDILKSAEAFKKDYPGNKKTAFLIMQFTKSKPHDALIKAITEVLLEFDIICLRADHKEYSDDLFSNIKTYMHCCDFGIAIYESIKQNDINPNVSLEVGYMMALNKKVCLLKDESIQGLMSDLAGKLYKPIDMFDIENSIKEHLTKWLIDKNLTAAAN